MRSPKEISALILAKAPKPEELRSRKAQMAEEPETEDEGSDDEDKQAAMESAMGDFASALASKNMSEALSAFRDLLDLVSE